MHGPTVRGHGIDIVDVERFRTSLARTPSMLERLFTAHELADLEGAADPVPSLAVRFAAREATMKAMGLGLGAFGFHDVWVRRRPSGEPELLVEGQAATLAGERGISRWWVSLSHTRTTAIASVIAE